MPSSGQTCTQLKSEDGQSFTTTNVRTSVSYTFVFTLILLSVFDISSGDSGNVSSIRLYKYTVWMYLCNTKTSL